VEGPAVTCGLRIAGRPVAVRVEGRDLAATLLGAFAPLCAPLHGAAPALTIAITDGEVTGTAPPIQAPPGREWVDASDPGRVVCVDPERAVTVLDRAAGHIAAWRASAGAVRFEERTKPLALPLAVWLHDRNVGVVHAGLVARGGRGVLVVGDAGAGKSTTALACAAGGFAFLGDDRIAVEGRTGHLLSGRARLAAGALARDPWLADGATVEPASGRDKALLAPRGATASATICAIVLPERGAAAVLPATAGAILRAMAPTSLLGVAGGGADGFARLSALARAVPAFRLRSDDPADVPDLVAQALERAR
jgi:hypothetical protein